MRLVCACFMATVLLLVAPSAARSSDLETAEAVGELLQEIAVDVSGQEGQWTARYRGSRIVVYAIENHGRMRIMAPIASAKELDEAELRILLQANYARALDAKFALQDGVVWSIFNRPLEGLTRSTFLDGAEQVVTLKKNYGTSYRSTELTFGRLE